MPKSPPTQSTNFLFNANVTKEIMKTKKIIKSVVIKEPINLVVEQKKKKPKCVQLKMELRPVII
jgi:hypothetical protein